MDLLKNLDNMITAKLILTGKETYDPEYPTVSKYDAIEAMIEFAKLHVEACKEEYLQKGFGRYMNHTFDKYPTRVPIDEDSILNAYPLENIK